MSAVQPSPSELRAMFGANLRKLSEGYPSVSELSRQLGINRTQFNRYLSGESFPRPDVLARVCRFFDVDARVLLEPVDDIGMSPDPIMNPFLKDYLAVGARNVPDELFPSGFFRFSRRSFLRPGEYIIGLFYIFRKDNTTFLRGYETASAMRYQELPLTGEVREFRGLIMRQDAGVAVVVARKKAITSSFSFLSRVASFENNFWLGFATRTVPESAEGVRATRMVCEYLGPNAKHAMAAARSTGFHTAEELPPLHRRLLTPDKPFT